MQIPNFLLWFGFSLCPFFENPRSTKHESDFLLNIGHVWKVVMIKISNTNEYGIGQEQDLPG